MWAAIVILLVCISGCRSDQGSAGLQLGDTAPDFMAKDLSGRVLVMSSFTGKPIILRFFETNCRFCKADTPVFTELYHSKKEQGLQVFYVGSFYESEEALQLFAKELGVDFPVLQDREAKLADLYDIRVYPQTIFIGPDQKILAALLGGVGRAEIDEIFSKYWPAE